MSVFLQSQQPASAGHQTGDKYAHATSMTVWGVGCMWLGGTSIGQHSFALLTTGSDPRRRRRSEEHDHTCNLDTEADASSKRKPRVHLNHRHPALIKSGIDQRKGRNYTEKQTRPIGG